MSVRSWQDLLEEEDLSASIAAGLREEPATILAAPPPNARAKEYERLANTVTDPELAALLTEQRAIEADVAGLGTPHQAQKAGYQRPPETAETRLRTRVEAKVSAEQRLAARAEAARENTHHRRVAHLEHRRIEALHADRLAAEAWEEGRARTSRSSTQLSPTQAHTSRWSIQDHSTRAWTKQQLRKLQQSTEQRLESRADRASSRQPQTNEVVRCMSRVENTACAEPQRSPALAQPRTTRSADKERTRPLDKERTRSLDKERTRSLDKERTRSLNKERTRPLDKERTRPLDKERTRSLDKERTRPLDKERARPLDKERPRTTPRVDRSNPIRRENVATPKDRFSTRRTQNVDRRRNTIRPAEPVRSPRKPTDDFDQRRERLTAKRRQRRKTTRRFDD